jgi:histidinol-phosphate/aromatic aminotransferase/cobyric acid decarboxylase-like protein
MNELQKIASEMARKEKKVKEFKRRVRAKGKIVKKGLTKNGNIKLIIKKADDKYNFIVIKTHKERFELAENLKVGDYVSAQGVNRFRAIICTQLKKIRKIDETKQIKLEEF